MIVGSTEGRRRAARSIRKAHRVGARFVAIAPVYRDRVSYPAEAARMAAHRSHLRESMRGAGIPYLEIPELMEDAHPANKGLFGELIHPNAEGHRLIASLVAEPGFEPVGD